MKNLLIAVSIAVVIIAALFFRSYSVLNWNDAPISSGMFPVEDERILYYTVSADGDRRGVIVCYTQPSLRLEGRMGTAGKKLLWSFPHKSGISTLVYGAGDAYIEFSPTASPLKKIAVDKDQVIAIICDDKVSIAYIDPADFFSLAQSGKNTEALSVLKSSVSQAKRKESLFLPQLD